MLTQARKQIGKWYIFPNILGTKTKTGKFGGYYTKDDNTQIPGYFPIGQNIKFTDGYTPTNRPGYTAVGTEVINSTPVKRAWRFERRDGVEIEMKAYDTGVYYRIDGLMTDFKLLKSGFTAAKEFFFGVINAATKIPSAVYFGNGVEPINIWSGTYGTLASFNNGANTLTLQSNVGFFAATFASLNNGAHTLTIQGATSLNDLGFLNAGSFFIDGVTINYTGISGQNFTGCDDMSGLAATVAGDNITQSLYFPFAGTLFVNGVTITYTGIIGATYTFTGCSTMAALTAAAGDPVIEAPGVPVNLTYIYSSVGLAHDDRLHCRDEKKPSVTLYSHKSAPENFSTGSSDGDGGAKELETGGPITAYAHDEKTLYIFKKRLIKTLQFTAVDSSRLDQDTWGTLKPSDDRSTTIGAIGQKSTFHSPNGIIFVTEDKEMLHLTRQSTIDYPQTLSISDEIKPTFQAGVHDEAAGIVFESKVFYSYKQDIHSTYNDTVIVYDLIRQIWHPPYIGWNVNDWTIINNKLHWHSSINSNSYEVDDTTISDNGQTYTAILRTWSEDFGSPEFTKSIGYAFVEIKMNEIAQVQTDIMYDQNGIAGVENFTLKGLDINNLIETTAYNPYGASSFGIEMFGSNAEQNELKRYLYIIPLKANIDFYTVDIQFTSEIEGSKFELIKFGYYLESMFEQPNKKYLKSI